MEVVRLRGVEHLDKLLTTAVDDFVEAFVCKATVVCVADGSIMNWGSVKPLSEESYSLSLALVMVEWPSSSGKGARPTEDELPPPWTLDLHEGPLPSPMVFRGAGLSTVCHEKEKASALVVVFLSEHLHFERRPFCLALVLSTVAFWSIDFFLSKTLSGPWRPSHEWNGGL